MRTRSFGVPDLPARARSSEDKSLGDVRTALLRSCWCCRSVTCLTNLGALFPFLTKMSSFLVILIPGAPITLPRWKGLCTGPQPILPFGWVLPFAAGLIVRVVQWQEQHPRLA